MHAQPILDDIRTTIPIGKLNVQLLAPRERVESGDRISFWWGVTSSAVALSRHLATSGELQDQRVVELGCGVGLAGITAGLLGSSVTFTDYMPEALEFARNNCLLNGVDMNRTHFVQLDWEHPSSAIHKFPYPYPLPEAERASGPGALKNSKPTANQHAGVLTDFTLVIGSEIAYDYFTHSALIKLMEALTAPGGRIVLAERKRLAVSRFVGRLIDRGFSSSETTSLIADPGLPSQEITIFTIERSAP